MKRKIIADWVGATGNQFYAFADNGVRMVNVHLVTEGCSVFIQEDGGEPLLVFHGSGQHSIEIGVRGGFALLLHSKPAAHHALFVPSERVETAGWVGAESYAQLETKAPDTMSPQVRQMVERMQHNALIREARLREEFERKLSARSS